MRIAVAICTTGRPAIVADCVARLNRQTRLPDEIVVCGAASQDVAGLADQALLTVLISKIKGSCAQRNVALEHIGDRADVILFMDDDFLLHETYTARVEAIFTKDPTIVSTTGWVVVDGISTATGYTFEEAERVLAETRVTPEEGSKNEWIRGVYGCNFAIRQRVALAQNVRFDERLPLYGWQEDIDFTVRLSRFGRVLRTNALIGVHLGVKGGRQSGLRVGYSQVSNPVYLYRKGTMGAAYALKLVSRNFAANFAGSLRTEGTIDRRGRLKGNLIALQDILLHRRVTPERILEL